MSDEDENTVSNSVALTLVPTLQQQALNLKTLAEQTYTSGDLKSAVKHAKQAHKLHSSLAGLPEMLAAFSILRATAVPVFGGVKNSIPDYYKILQVERFSHINTIKKQYKKLALSLHPDKNRFAACEEAFKLVGEAMQVLTDRIRRKEYDMRLRIGMQSKAAEETGEVGSVETFWTACSSCRLLHKFERRYLGHSLMCPRCKKSFEAREVEGGESDERDKNEGVETMNTRMSVRIRERVAKGENLGIRKKSSDVDEDEDEDESGVLLKDMRLKRVKNVGKSGGRDGDGIEGRLKEVRELVNDDKSGESKDAGVVNELRLRRVASKLKDGVEDEAKSGVVEAVVSGRAKRAKVREEETMTLSQLQMKVRDKVEEEGKSGGVETFESGRDKRTKSREEESMTLLQFQMLAKTKKKKKIDEGKLRAGEKEISAEELEEKRVGNEKENDSEIGEERETEKEIGEEKETDKNIGEERDMEEIGEESETMEKGKDKELEMEEEKKKEMVNIREKRIRRRASKYMNLEVVEQTSKGRVNSQTESHGSSRKRNAEIMIAGSENDNENSKEEMEGVRQKRERRRVSKYANLDIVKRKTSENNHVNSEIERLIAAKKGNLEILPVENSDFHDFDKDRRERSFKKGQVWAVYADDDGMPRHYALVDEIVSLSPFHLTLSWLEYQSSNGDEELISWQKMGFHVSCGRFKVSKEVSIKHLNLFSHVVNCERAAREVYRVYPKKGSVWALYKTNAMGCEERDQTVKDNIRCYDIVVCLSSYSDVYGLSIARLEKVHGFRTVFKRREIGANAVIWLGKNDVKLFSHQIPAMKLSGEESSGLPKVCWELDPASLTPQLLTRS